MLWFGLATHSWKQLGRGQTTCLKLGPLSPYGHAQRPDSQSLKSSVVRNVISLHFHSTQQPRHECVTMQACPHCKRSGVGLNPLLHLLPSTLGKALRKHIGARERAQEGFKNLCWFANKHRDEGPEGDGLRSPARSLTKPNHMTVIYYKFHKIRTEQKE